MRTGKYSFKELFVNRYVTNIVIPEIQRDYVWGHQQVKGFLQSLYDSFNQYCTATVPLKLNGGSEGDNDIEEEFRDFYRRRHFSANIGFIYAYSDEEYQGRYFLIDGQQRITTLYIVLLLLATRTGMEDDFKKNYVRGGVPVLDYRVRDASTAFLKKMVEHAITFSDLNLKDQLWYLDDYDNDKTITSIVSNLDFARQWLSGLSLGDDETKLYHYLQSMTECWYFDTNISAQGENLYIYLNARGEQVQGNENLKADMLSKFTTIREQNSWGRKWETWQDYFWRNRGLGVLASNPNADKGFNGFLYCIAALELYLSEDEKYLLNSLKDERKIHISELSSVLKIDVVEKYINALEYIDKNKDNFKKKYQYSGWVDKCISQLWEIFNHNNTEWFVNYKHPESFSTQARNMVFVWGVIHWVTQAVEKGIDNEAIFRALRQFYLRYHNNIRTPAQIKSSIESLLSTGFISNDSNREEFIKERWLQNIPGEEINREIESLIWEIEDHPLNIDGSDVGAVNITHLIVLNDQVDDDLLIKIRDTFKRCFPTKSGSKALSSLLLYYGAYARTTTPKSYDSYSFSDWKYIIRGIGSSSRRNNTTFNDCFDDLMKKDGSVEDLLEQTRKEFVPDIQATNFNEQVKWYNYYLHENMWQVGNKIVLARSWGGQDRDLVFKNQLPFYNLDTDFRSSATLLSNLLPGDVKRQLSMEQENG